MITSGRSRAYVVVVVFLTVVSTAPAKYSGGTGEPNDPYQIATAEDLMLLGDSPEDYDKHFILTADIDLDPNLPGRKVFDRAVIAPGSNWRASFSGVFDGNGHTISHLTIKGQSYLGLFGQLGDWYTSVGGEVKNLGVVEMNITGSGDCVGGIVGGSDDGTINQCYSTGSVSGTDDVGGLVGYTSFGGIILNSYSTGSVSGTYSVGGLVGITVLGGIILNSYSTGSVSGTGGVGGLVGENEGGSIRNSYSTGSVSGTYSVGGLVGNNGGYIATSYSMSSVSGIDSVGGLVGSNSLGIGWLVFDGGITYSYSSGLVSGTGWSIGGLVGANDYSGWITTSFWDIESSGQAASDGGTGKTTAEMQDIEMYLSAGWDFVGEIRNGTCDYWQISTGDYPRLRYPVMLEGLGTAEQPYLIRDAWDLGTVWFEPLAHYRLARSIDLSGTTWSMAVIPWFKGSFDGNDFVITNLHIQGDSSLGLFGYLDGTVSNLGLEAVDVNGTGSRVGGLVGDNFSGSITNCYSTGTVNGTGDSVGGLVGENDGSIITCYSTGTVNGTGWRVGGLVGINHYGHIVSSYSSGVVKGAGAVGGLVGANGGYIVAGSSAGLVTGQDEVGGLVGYNQRSIVTSYSHSSVSGRQDVGGLVGYNVPNLWEEPVGVVASYSAGAVVGNQDVGGLAGRNEGNIDASFWDVQTSGQTTSAGGTGKTTAEMQTAKTFFDAGWDFVDETTNGTEDLWWILEGQDYPRLWWELPAAK